MSPYWIGILRYLTWGLFAVIPAIFLPQHMPMIAVIPIAFVWAIVAMFIAGRLWSALAAVFGWQLRIEDDYENSN